MTQHQKVSGGICGLVVTVLESHISVRSGFHPSLSKESKMCTDVVGIAICRRNFHIFAWVYQVVSASMLSDPSTGRIFWTEYLMTSTASVQSAVNQRPSKTKCYYLNDRRPSANNHSGRIVYNYANYSPSPMIRSAATGTQWKGPMKLRIVYMNSYPVA